MFMTKLNEIMKMMEGLGLDELHALREFLLTLISAVEREQTEPGSSHEDEREVVA
jgi:hypothetical protein